MPKAVSNTFSFLPFWLTQFNVEKFERLLNMMGKGAKNRNCLLMIGGELGNIDELFLKKIDNCFTDVKIALRRFS